MYVPALVPVFVGDPHKCDDPACLLAKVLTDSLTYTPMSNWHMFHLFPHVWGPLCSIHQVIARKARGTGARNTWDHGEDAKAAKVCGMSQMTSKVGWGNERRARRTRRLRMRSAHWHQSSNPHLEEYRYIPNKPSWYVLVHASSLNYCASFPTDDGRKRFAVCSIPNVDVYHLENQKTWASAGNGHVCAMKCLAEW